MNAMYSLIWLFLTSQVKELDLEELKTIPKINEYYEKIQDWNWRYGNTPEFSNYIETRFPWGTLVSLTPYPFIEIRTCTYNQGRELSATARFLAIL